MTLQQIKDITARIDASYPGLRLRDRYAWTHRVAYACYKVDHTVGQKRASLGRPVSDDTIAWAVSPVGGQAGTAVQVAFNAIDLLDGGSGNIHFDENPGITDQFFVIPTPIDIDGEGATSAPPSGYPGDATWDAVGLQLVSDYARAGRPIDAGTGRWFGRVIWDATAGDGSKVLTVPESIAKHRIEWCAALGVPVV